MKKGNVWLLLSVGFAGALFAAEKKEAETFASRVATPEQSPQFTYGGDVRLRTIYFDNIPIANGGESRGGVNSFQRYRTRLWGQFQAADNLKFNARLVNEFRTYQNRSKTPGTSAWNPLDEIVFDNLFVDWNEGDWSVRIGRQDLIYGTGKVILDGTPKDGSRTIYFDAVKASYTGFEDTVVDFLLMSTLAKDPLAIRSEDRDIVGYGGGNAYEGSETGGGVYVKNQSRKELPFEAYYLVKTHEQENVPAAVPHTNDRHTVGVRLMPKFSNEFDANLELAYQFGSDISAYMVDAALNWHVPALADIQGCASLGWYYLSGDDPGSASKDEGWNPLWSRWPQYSELYVYAYDVNGAGRWSNVSMPHVDFSFRPTGKLHTSLMVGWLFAPETDGPSNGRNRGFLATLWNRFTLKEKMLSDRDKLTGHVLVELFEPDDYYNRDQRNTAVFVRAELNYAF